MLKNTPLPSSTVIGMPFRAVFVRSKGFDRLHGVSWTIIPLLTSGANQEKKDLSTGTSQIRVGGPHVIVSLRYLLSVLVTRGPMDQCNN